MDRKNIIIGLDGATWEILDRFSDENIMPSVKKLKEKSSYGKLKSTIVPITPSAWASMLTGCSPPQTGIFDFLKTGEGDSYSKKIVNGSDIRVPTMWDVLTSYNKKVISVNVPMTFPPMPVNGIVITGMMTPFNAGNYCFPEAIKDELTEHGISYRIDTELHNNRNKFLSDDDFLHSIFSDGAKEFFRDLNSLLDVRIKTINYLMSEKQWDYFMFVLIGIDRIQHHFWDYLKDPELDRDITVNIQNYYRRVDEFIGKIYGSYQNTANILIVSDHGFSKLHGTLMTDAWLMKQGYLKLNEKRAGKAANIAKKPFQKLGARGKKVIKKMIGKENLNRLNLSAHSIDWANTMAYGAETNGININLKGRDQLGNVETDDYDEVRQNIINSLMNLTFHDGRKIVKKALKKEEVYKEGELSHVPDIIIVFHDDFIFQARYSENPYKDMEMFVENKWLTGFHIQDGVFLAVGQDICEGKEIDDIRIEDVFPTLMALNNENIPNHVDGRVVDEILMKGIDLNYVNFNYDADSKKYHYSQDGEDEIKEKLKSLGYI